MFNADQLKQINSQLEFLEEDASNETPPEPKSAQYPVSDGKTYSTAIVSMVAYMIGVPSDNFGKNFQRSIFDTLEQITNARVVRCLCSIRNELMKHPGDIYHKLRNDLKNLDTMPEFIDPSLFLFLSQQNIRIVKGSQTKEITEYLKIVNNHISNLINQCASLFPSWVKWEYISDVFTMPDGSKSKNIQAAIDTFKSNRSMYPYQCYLDWNVQRPEYLVENVEHYVEPFTSANILYNDKKFITLLYRMHDETFQDLSHVFDASVDAKKQLEDYFRNNAEIVLLVDCENSNPYKLCCVFDFLKEASSLSMQQGDQRGFGRITKIMLFDDYHTIDAWDILENYAWKDTEIVHEEVERVLRHKSLVDIAMTANACKEYYMHKARAFIVASSDSDFWGLMRQLPDAAFLVLAEKEGDKFSSDMAQFYALHDVHTCIIDGFAGNMNKIKEKALYHSIEKRINSMTFNLLNTFEDAYDALQLDMSESEKENLRRKLSRSLYAKTDEHGEIEIKFY